MLASYPPLPSEAGPPPPPPPMQPPPPPAPPPPQPSTSAPASKHHHASKRAKQPAPPHSRNGAQASRRPPEAGAPPPDNRLKRDTPFIATIRFKNDLPEVPCDPKLLVAPLQPEALAAFKLAQMEKALCPDLLVSLDPSCLSFIDIQRFRVPPGPPAPIDPADAPLLLDSSSKGKPGAGKDGHSWLLKTRWMQAHDDVDHSRAFGAQEGAAPEREQMSRAQVLAHIEEMFQAAKRDPVHPRDPSLVPVEVMPILPDMDCWTHDFATTVCDSEMLTHVDCPRMGKRQRQFLKEHALMKPYTYPDRDADIQFIAQLVPREAPPEADLEAAGDAVAFPDPVEGIYDWTREFSYRKDREDRGNDDSTATYAFMLGKQATYVKVNHSFVLNKRRRKDMMQVPIPERITVTKRNATPEETAKHRSKMNVVYGIDDELVVGGAKGDQPGAGEAAPLIDHENNHGSLGTHHQDDLFSDDEEDAT